MKRIYLALLCTMGVMGCSDKQAQKDASDTAAADQKAAEIRQQYEDRQAELEEEDKLHFDWPKVDYTQAVAKVDIKDDRAIIKAVGTPDPLLNKKNLPMRTENQQQLIISVRTFQVV
ncbi:hypothetical protein [Acinetobacter sp. WU_MDCI_Abxc222]|uniref:hypothetical protein n=1 Tax=Acinetobacter sp. WU_MDCI_Abxc222 TaxID=2850076 RepID=UPI0021CD483B|nr:hypothetical protein [Acinetobacter sp. WU_MDCI_Abxc222]